MLSRTLFRQTYRLRNKKSEITLEQVQQMRDALFQDAFQKYYPPFVFNHKDELFEEKLYGNNCYIAGLTRCSFLSSTFTSKVIKYLNPQHLILGGMNNSELKTMNLVDQPKNNMVLSAQKDDILYEPQKMFCKSTLSPIVNEQILSNPYYFFDKQSQVLLIANKSNKRIQVRDNLTAVQTVALKDSCKLSYGKPSDIIIFQDIILTTPLQELKSAYNKVISDVFKAFPNHTSFEPSFIVDFVQYYGEYQPVFYQKQILYTSALLNKYSRLTNNTLLLTSKKFCKKIAEQVHDMNINPALIYRQYLQENSNSENRTKLETLLHEQNREQKINQILQKLAILCIVKGSSLQIELFFHQVNIFEKSIFASLFEKMEIQQIKQRYIKSKKQYMDKLNNLQNKWVQNVLDWQDKSKQFYTLSEQMQIMEERSTKFPFEYQPNNVLIEKQNQKSVKLLSKTMKQIVQEQFPPNDAEIFQNHLEGNMTKESIILYTKLVGKAKLRLGLGNLKLPKYHYGAFEGIYKEYIDDEIRGNKKRYSVKQVSKQIKDSAQKHSHIRFIEDDQQLQEILQKSEKEVKHVNLEMSESGGLRMDEGNQDDLETMLKESKMQDFFRQIDKDLRDDMKK